MAEIKKPAEPEKKQPVDYPISIGYHSLRIKPGESIQIAKDGTIQIVSRRGKITDTGKNILTKPAMYGGSPLSGDVQSIKYVSKLYGDKRQKVHPLFRLWKDLLGIVDDAVFKPATDIQGERIYKCTVGTTSFYANSNNPSELLYIDVNGQRFYHTSAGPARDIPATVDYVKACAKEYRDYMSQQEKQRMAELETSGLSPRVTKAQRRRQARLQKQLDERMLEICTQEARVDLEKKYGLDKPVIHTSQSMLAMGIITPERAEILMREEEADRRAQQGDKLSKEELAALAKQKFEDLKAGKI